MSFLDGVFNWIYKTTNEYFRFWWVFLLIIFAFVVFVMWPRA